MKNPAINTVSYCATISLALPVNSATLIQGADEVTEYVGTPRNFREPRQ